MAESQAENRDTSGRAPKTPSATSGEPKKPQIGDTRPAPTNRTPRIGDTRPAPPTQPVPPAVPPNQGTTKSSTSDSSDGSNRRRRRRGSRGQGRSSATATAPNRHPSDGNSQNRRGSGSSREKRSHRPVEAIVDDALELDEKALKQHQGRTRKGQAVGRYMMCVSVGEKATQIATLEGRRLVEHQVSRPADDISQIYGNIYYGRVQNVLPGMEAAFVEIGTPKNAVLYRGDVQYDADDVEGGRAEQPRIEDILKARQSILCQVTKNPIAHKGARLTQEVSLPGRFVVLVPNSSTYGISKRLPDSERSRLRKILDKAKPEGHGVIVRTAAEKVTAKEIQRDVARLVTQWQEIEKLATQTKAPALVYREPEAALRIIREEFTKDFRGIVIDDRHLYEEVTAYVSSITPALAERVRYYDPSVERLPLFERYHIHEQLLKALDRKVWLPSGGSLVIEATEALTVIDVNTGKNVGSSNLEETVFRNNLEAAEEVAKQLRLRDIGGIIVIDFVDMEIAKNSAEVMKTFRAALARDKTRTQVFDISGLGLVEMTRKRIGEGLLESVSDLCDTCEGDGHVLIDGLIG